MDTKGKVALVTGAGRGIGLAIIEKLAAEGAIVALLARTESEIKSEAAAINDAGGKAIHICCDQRSPDAAQEAIETVREQFGALHILVNNAGVGRFDTVADMSPADWDAVLHTNLDGVFYMTHAALPLMFETGNGFIINIGSMSGKTRFPKGAAYCASKWGLIGFTDSLIMEVRDKGIRASIVMPGSVDTTFVTTNLPQTTPADWKIGADDIATAVLDIIHSSDKSHISRVEIRPSTPPPKK
jgi:NAD(P)-dependent dehydrogenase (short-subunit alcohol dehydrogenase family)